jgi:lysine decarboxylase
MSIEKALEEYTSSKVLRFHMPGHKGRDLYEKEASFLNWKNDVTEVEGLDNLHNPRGVIKDAMDKISEIYGVDKTFISTNGSTSALHSAILSVTKPKDKILISRDCHKAVYNAVLLGEIQPIYIPSEIDKETRLSCIRNLVEFEKLIKENLDIKAVVLPYPTYFGLCSDIKAIAKIVHKYNKILIVDEAHGSHLKFCDNLPIAAEESGGDIIIQSTHKTLPALTQGSLLHINVKSGIDIYKLESVFSMLVTTSPSYLIMNSVEKAVSYMTNSGKERLQDNIDFVRKISFKYKYAKEAYKGSAYFKENGFFDFDDSKLLFRTDLFGINGNLAKNILRDEYNIEMEMATPEYINGFITSNDNKEDIELLFKAVNDLIKKYKIDERNQYILDYEYNFTPEVAMNIRDAFYSEKEEVSIEDSKGKVSGDYIIPYPPGIPLVCMGEIFTEKIIETIKKYIGSGIEVIGVKNNRVKIIK